MLMQNESDNCFSCQLIFKKEWLPQQLPVEDSCDLQHDTSCMLHSTESLPLVGESWVNWCPLGDTSTAAPTYPCKVADCLSSWSGGRWYGPMAAFIPYCIWA